jgi:hypothetical protein
MFSQPKVPARESVSEEQLRELAGLKYNPAFQLLLDRLQLEIDDLSDAMQLETVDSRLLGMTRKWQAMRSQLSLLRDYPAFLDTQFKEQDQSEGRYEEPIIPDQQSLFTFNAE